MAFAGKYCKIEGEDHFHESGDDLEENKPGSSRSSSITNFFNKKNSLPFRDNADLSTPYLTQHTTTKAGASPNFWTWLRWGVVVGLQTTLIILISIKSNNDTRTRDDLQNLAAGGEFVETGSDINGIYKTLSHTYTYLKPEEDKYVPNMTSNDNRMEIRKNWDMLMPLGSGSVLIPDYRDHPLLGDPITDDPIRSGPLFEASWTHALHCLYYSVDSYHQLIVNGPSEDDNPRHAAHCFEYLRNSILCNLDMTLEGSMSTPDDKERGQPHVCRNREEAISWIEARRMDDAQDIVGP
ncbi:hypothetical protein CFAM422_013198 [Trichoderma lentiforme]|uniref:Uncharacterized protein n=1 Tax=Trichoderma lentiforme TaxID=1567552 RepID=A0A9P4X3K1_9HYPO|nr:hypothetical protein CFAM422_013198 [Trichoderma lentiforme]